MTAEQVRQNRLRRMAERQGLGLTKNRRRDPLAVGFGTFAITRDGKTIAGPGLTVDEVEDFLTQGRAAR